MLFRLNAAKIEMAFETKKDVLDWYERQERALTPEFLSSIPWHTIKDHPLDARLVPVLFYMRDVETLTDMYQRELCRTPTGKDPHISKFMERWGVEEITHGEVINRFLNEIGFETDEKWQEQVRRNVSKTYKAKAYFITAITNLMGKRFTATHLIELGNHPVLTHILKAIIREESAHAQFYRNIAKLELKRNEFAQKMARWVIDHFWEPVGAGSLSQERSDQVIQTLFAGDTAIDALDQTVTQRVRQLPGFADITKMTDTIGGIARSALAASLIGTVILNSAAGL